MKNTAVLGGGAFGSALAKVTNADIVWSYLNKQPFYAVDCKITGDINESMRGRKYVFLAINTEHLPEWIPQLRLDPDTKLVICSKGLVEHDSIYLQSHYLEDKLGIRPENLAVISGPTIAKELYDGKPTFATVASANPQLCYDLNKITASNFHLVPSTDMYGVQIAGCLKNAYANIMGIEKGLSEGEDNANLKAALRAFCEYEMKKATELLFPHFYAGQKYEPKPSTGLETVGDLAVTVIKGRNHYLGELIGKGFSLAEALKVFGDEEPEGPGVVKKIKKLIKEGELPLIDQAYKLLYKPQSTREKRKKACKRAVEVIIGRYHQKFYGRKNGFG